MLFIGLLQCQNSNSNMKLPYNSMRIARIRGVFREKERTEEIGERDKERMRERSRSKSKEMESIQFNLCPSMAKARFIYLPSLAPNEM